MKSHPLIAIVAGEVSGDRLGAGLMKDLLKIIPHARFQGIGGEVMAEVGFESLYPMERLSVMGIGAILKRLPELVRARKQLVKKWTTESGKQSEKPDLFIGIDAPEFNTGLELSLKRAGIKTLHYVSPSVWAWRPGRIKKIRQAVDHMLTLFPFETTIYKQHHVDVSCVGHPMADEIPLEFDQDNIRNQLGLDQKKKILAILPGSRGSELKFLAPLFIEVAEQLLKQNPQLQIISAMANQRCRDIFENELAKYDNVPIQLFEKQSREVMMAADVVLLASGTATLEAALVKKPMVVSYKVSPMSYQVFSRLSVLTHYALPNLLVEKPFVVEFLQNDATLENITEEVNKLLKASTQQKQQLHDIYLKLHQSLKLGGSRKAATVVAEMLAEDK